MATNMKFLIANAFLAGVTLIAMILTLSQGNPAVAATTKTTPITLNYLSDGTGNVNLGDQKCGSAAYFSAAAAPVYMSQKTITGAKLSAVQKIYRCTVSFKVVK